MFHEYVLWIDNKANIRTHRDARVFASAVKWPDEMFKLERISFIVEIWLVVLSLQVRRSLKIRGRRKEKEKLPSGITADYSANFFAHLDLDRDVERDRGVEEVMADANATIDNNGDAGDHVMSINVSHSDSSETSLQSVGVNKVKIIVFIH